MVELVLAFREVSPIFFTYLPFSSHHNHPSSPPKKIKQEKENGAFWPWHGFILEFEERKVSYSIFVLSKGLFPESPGNPLGPESCLVFAMFVFKIKVSIIWKMIQ